MKITFCLPSILKVPAGGFKIVFEYANRLVKLGHTVSIVFLTDAHYVNYTNSLFLKNILSKFRIINYPDWFDLDKRISRIATPYVDGRAFPNSDIIVATSARTSQIVANLPDNKGRKFYLIQGFENWSMSDDDVIKTYKLGFNNITIAKWLEELIWDKAGVKATTISNPIDISKFYVNQKINGRNKFELAMLYHEGKHKGIDTAFKALEIVYKFYPGIHVNLFGVYDPPELPNYFTYTKKATEIDLLNIYNKSAIFVCASEIEGFGLTGAESMACGCALVSTSYQGVFEYAKDGINSLLSPVKDSEGLANNIIKLIDDDDLRHKLALQGSEDIKRLSWDIAVQQLEKLLNENN